MPLKHKHGPRFVQITRIGRRLHVYGCPLNQLSTEMLSQIVDYAKKEGFKLPTNDLSTLTDNRINLTYLIKQARIEGFLVHHITL